MKTVIEMAGEVLDRMAPDDHCRAPYWTATDEELERFVELVREEANARANASWTLMCEKMVAIEREACAKVCEQSEIPIPLDVWHGSTKKEMTEHTALALAKAIRARSTHEA